MAVHLSQIFRLSEGFFQRLEEDGIEDSKPVLQVLKSIAVDEGSPNLLHLSDGSASYNLITLVGTAMRKFEINGVKGYQPIIEVLKFHRRRVPWGEAERIHLVIEDFNLLVRDGRGAGAEFHHNEQTIYGNSDKNSQSPLDQNSRSQSPPKKVMKSNILDNCEEREIRRVLLDDISHHFKEYIDVVAVVHKMENPRSKKTKKNGYQLLQEIELIDEADIPVNLAVWGDKCKEFTRNFSFKPIILKNVYVKEQLHLKGYELTAVPRTEIIMDERNETAKNVLRWYQTRGPNGSLYDGAVTIKYIQDCYKGGQFNENSYFNIIGEVIGLGDTFHYKTCVDTNCSSKVEEVKNRIFKCRNCKATSTQFNTKSIVIIYVKDNSSSTQRIFAYNDVAENFLGKKGSEILGTVIMHSNNKENIKRLLGSDIIGKKYFFRIKVDVINDKKWNIIYFKPVQSTGHSNP
uniref:Rep_fac-A_C domain-containing protein n=1 Tax=Strongyloides papillosus TaxID=174720 RepID=A0A0N5CCR6_STREA